MASVAGVWGAVPAAGVESLGPSVRGTAAVPLVVFAAVAAGSAPVEAAAPASVVASSSDPPHAARRPTHTSPAVVARCRT